MTAIPFEYPLTIQKRHLDAFGHVNNARYLEILEEARWAIVSSRGKGMDEILRSKVAPVLLDVRLQFLRELKLGQEVLVRTQATELGVKTFRLRQMIEDSTGNLCLNAKLTIGLFDLVQRKLTPMSLDWHFAVGVQN